MEDLISIIVPVYNVDKYLRNCVDSILGQTYRNIEIILIDDGSKDQSGKICDEYKKIDDRVIVIHQKNSGVSSARNKGIELSKGKWITFVDSDDWIEKDFCKVLYTKAIENQCDVALCGYNRVGESNIETININGHDNILGSKEYMINSLNPQTGFGFCHMKLFNKNIIKNNRFDEKLLVGEDAIFNEMISKNINRAIFIKKALYNYRMNMNSVVKKYDENYANKYLNSMKINKEYIFKYYKDSKEIIQNYYNYVAYHVLLVAVNYCYNPDNKTKNKRKSLKEVCNYKEFRDGIKNSNYNNISTTRKITLFTIKHNLYFLAECICKYRQKQNRRK